MKQIHLRAPAAVLHQLAEVEEGVDDEEEAVPEADGPEEREEGELEGGGHAQDDLVRRARVRRR